MHTVIALDPDAKVHPLNILPGNREPSPLPHSNAFRFRSLCAAARVCHWRLFRTVWPRSSPI